MTHRVRTYTFETSHDVAGTYQDRVVVARVVDARHCQLCGSTAREDIDTGDGYTRCCLERVIDGGDCEGQCGHSDESPWR